MSSNSSSSFNASLLPPHLSSSNVYFYFDVNTCFDYRSAFVIFNVFTATYILLLLPLCTFVLYLGVERWRRQRSKAASHSDMFTYHMVAMELIGIIGCCFWSWGIWVDEPGFALVGTAILNVATNGQIPFHILTCVERHMAVVFPITYLRLRETGGVRIRNIAIGCAWLFFLGLTGVNIRDNSSVLFFLISIVSITVISFCSLSVLWALIRPGPGEGGGDRERVDRSKMRAFHIITAIMGVLLFRFGGHILAVSLYDSPALSKHVRCDVLVSGVWFGLPSSLILPLLFLQRVGKLRCCKNSNQSGQGSE